MTTTPHSARSVRAEWTALCSATPDRSVFEPGLIRHLPEAARRWLRHSIAPGTPLYPTALITMRGEIKLGSWRRFTARQVLAPSQGFIWAATARVGGLPVTGFDRYTRGSGEMRWRLGGVVPVLHATGADVTLSAAGRLAGESVCVPTAFPLAMWRSGATPDTATATWLIDGRAETVQLRVDPDGRLVDVAMYRWGNPGGAVFGRHPFGVAVDAERVFHGVTVPAEYRASWGRDEFLHATVTDVTFS
jgi:hypothetical protein